MEKIELNHWYVKENELSISLMKFYVNIKISKNDEFIYYQLSIIENSNTELVFNFYTIEDAISFTEQVVANSFDINEVREKYILMFENNSFSNPYERKKKK